MDLAVVGFWLGLLVPAIGYVFYPIVVSLLARTRPARVVNQSRQWPPVTVAIAAHNEEQTIKRAVMSVLQQDYPGPALTIIVGLDGCTDSTRSVVEAIADPRVRVLDLPRAGKASTDNQLVAASRSEVVVTTSAGSEFGPGTLTALVAPLRDPEVGCVTGIFRPRLAGGRASDAEGLYWRLEYGLMSAESRLGILAISSGTALAFRRSAFRPIPVDSDADVVVAPNVVLSGLRVVYEPDAVVSDDGPESMRAVLRNRRRMAVRALPATVALVPRLARSGRPGAAVALIAHKLCRWFTPAAALVWAISAVFLVGRWGSAYATVAVGLIAIVSIGLVSGLAVPRTRGPVASLGVAQIAFALALSDVVRGRRARTWTRGPAAPPAATGNPDGSGSD